MNKTTNRKNNLEKKGHKNATLKLTVKEYDALINNLPGILYRCKNNRNWEMEYISKGCLELTGYSSEEFLSGKVHFTNITLQEDHDQVWNNTQKSLNFKEPFNLEYKIKTKDDQLKYLWEQGEGIFDDNDKLIAIEGYITDITKQKEAERVIKASEAKNKALIEAIPDMMFIQDYNGNYLDFFTSDKDKFALRSEEIIGKNMKEILPTDVFEKIRKAQKKTIEDKQVQLVEYSLDQNNEIKYYEARVVAVNNHSLLTIVRDITEFRKKNNLLEIRNNALASASNAILIANAKHPKAPIIYCNEAFEKMTGYLKDEVLGRNCQYLQRDDRDQKEISIMKNAITNGKECNVVLRNYRKNGEKFWNNIAITPIYNQEKELTHFISVQNDVTHKIKEKHLKDQIRKILDLIVQDKSIKIIGEKILETTEAHLKDCLASILILHKVNKTLHTLAAPNVPKDVSQLIEGLKIGPKAGSFGTAAFLKKEMVVSNIKTNILWDGHKEFGEVVSKNSLKACWSFPILSSTKQVLGTFTIYNKNARRPSLEEKEIILDMTHLASVAIEKYNTRLALIENRKELEKYTYKLEEIVAHRTKEVMSTVQKLVESNLNLEDQILIAKLTQKKALASEILATTIAKNFPNGFVVVVDKNFKVLFAEGEALKQLGLKQLFFNSTTIDDLIIFSEERKKRIKHDISKTLSGKHIAFEIKYKSRYFSVNTTPLYDDEKKPTSALLVYNDITQHKAEEQNIKNALKREQELNELKSRFISMASHEFRTPLSAILTSAVLIGKQNEPGKELKRKKYLDQIEKNVKNLVVILNDFLSLSKLEEGEITASMEQFDLIHFSKMVLRETKFSLKSNQNVDFTATLDELLVKLDHKLLRHALVNLLSNASKYSPEKTTIDLKITTNQKTVRIEITDRGIGIPEEEQKNLFQRFFRAKNAANIEGTGLGLNIVKQYVSLMKGKVGFKSELQKGSTFYFELPIK